MIKDGLFYMANAHPEIERMIMYFNAGNMTAYEHAQKRAVGIIETILQQPDISPAGKEEWSVIRNFILGYDSLDQYEKKILALFAKPFAFKFMAQYSA